MTAAQERKLDAGNLPNWSEKQFRSLQQPRVAVRAVGISMMPIAKTSRFFLEKYPAYSSGQVVAEFAAGWERWGDEN
jgi:hypothetical protein